MLLRGTGKRCSESSISLKRCCSEMPIWLQPMSLRFKATLLRASDDAQQDGNVGSRDAQRGDKIKPPKRSLWRNEVLVRRGD